MWEGKGLRPQAVLWHEGRENGYSTASYLADVFWEAGNDADSQWLVQAETRHQPCVDALAQKYYVVIRRCHGSIRSTSAPSLVGITRGAG